jgi:hypothetical protein
MKIFRVKNRDKQSQFFQQTSLTGVGILRVKHFELSPFLAKPLPRPFSPEA